MNEVRNSAERPRVRRRDEQRSYSSLHSKLADDGARIRRFLDETIERWADVGINLPFRDDQLPLTPAVFASSAPARLQDAFRSVLRGIEQLASHLMARAGGLASVFDFAEEELRLADLCDGPGWGLVARPDFVSAGDRFGFIETNITTSVGLIGESEIIRRIQWEAPVVGDFLRALGCTWIDSVERFAQMLQREVPEARDKHLVLLDWADELDECAHDYEFLAQELRRRRFDVAVGAVENLEMDGGAVGIHGRPIDVVYRFFGTTNFRNPAVFDQYLPLFEAVASRRIRMVGTLRHKLYTPKLYLALLSDERYRDWISPDVAAVVDEFVPWTRVLEERATTLDGRRVDLLDFVSARREFFVLKPDLGFGGRDVIIGCDISQEEWDAELHAATSDPRTWLVQEYLQAEPAELAYADSSGNVDIVRSRVDFGMFMFDGSNGGLVRRNATTKSGGVTNLSRGGGLSPVFFESDSHALNQ